MKRRSRNLFLGFALIFGMASCSSPEIITSSVPNQEEDGLLPIDEKEDAPLRLWYDEEVQQLNEGASKATMGGGADLGWERWSLPLGNGYFGANVFGRTGSERIQITEKTLSNPWRVTNNNWQQIEVGGLNSFSETYIDFNHISNLTSDYYRYLDVNNAISGVSYTYEGTKYTREYFTSYPDKALVMYFDADQAGSISFTLRPTIPYKQSFMAFPGDEVSKQGQVTSSVSNGVGEIELSGKLGYYDVDFYGLYRVYTVGGSVTASSVIETYYDRDGSYHHDSNGTIEVSGANQAFVVVTLGTDYELSSDIFTSRDRFKPTALTDLDDAKAKVQTDMGKIDRLIANRTPNEAYQLLRQRHLDDYKSLYDRVHFHLDYDKKDLSLTTDALLRNYQIGIDSTYLENLIYQYSRYLLIASSRPGALPANLQGAWNAYNEPPWSSGYWHNINIQMNYWSAFSTNLAETFIPYMDFNDAYMAQAEANASTLVFQNNRSVYGKDGGNGWTIGVANNPFFINGDRSSGNMGFTTQLYWDYYQFTKDKTVLKKVYEILANAARYVTKCVKLDSEGHYLVESSDSPEQYVNGVWYYTSGTTYAQSFSYLNNYYTLLAAKEMGVDLDDPSYLSREEYSVLKTIMEQIDRYDPINVGLSGQIKEFREEDYYGSLGDPGHRHISQLVGLCPGNIITSATPAWLDAARVTLAGRDSQNNLGPALEQVGWSFVHRMGCYARIKDGKMAHQMLHDLADKQMTTNLLTLCGNVFQIEAILGTSATMTETMVQSHEGYIDLFPAMPESWKNGSIDGIVARGNFEMGLDWKDGALKKVSLLSKAGQQAKITYPSITSVKVVRDDGIEVAYEVIDENMISFATEEGHTYTLTHFVKAKKIDKPQNFTFEREYLSAFEFSWEKVEGASSYKLYKATGNNPTYEYVGSSLTNRISYTAPKEEINERTTFCLVAVDSRGRESDRVACFYNPFEADAQVYDASWDILEDGKLQVRVQANERSCAYRLYEKKPHWQNYVLLDESNFPLLQADAYHEDSLYAVTAVSAYSGFETPKYFINVNQSSNVFLGKEFTPTAASKASEYNATFRHGCLTDGIFDANRGRYSSKVNGMMDATMDLEGHYSLSEIRIYTYDRNLNYAGSSMTIEGYGPFGWETLYEIPSTNDFSQYRVGNDYLSFPLQNRIFSKIRIAVPKAVDSFAISFYEIEAYGFEIDGGKEEGSGNAIPSASISSTGAYGNLEAMQDGNPNTFAQLDGENGKAELTLTLPYPRELYSLTIKTDTPDLSDKTKIEAYVNGVWVVIAQGISCNDGLTVPFFGVKASKIRITFENSHYASDHSSFLINEISCTEAKGNDATSLLEALRQIEYSSYGVDYFLDEDYLRFLGYSLNENATSEEIASYLEDIQEYISLQ